MFRPSGAMRHTLLASFIAALALAHLCAAQNVCAYAMTVCNTDGGCDNSTTMTQCNGAPVGSECNVPGASAQGACALVSPTLACYPQCICRPNPSKSACGAKVGAPCVTQKYLFGVYGDYSNSTCQCLLATKHNDICYTVE